MIVTWCSVKGAPGVSSWSVLAAGMWPTESQFEVAVLEADPSGGAMASRYGVGVSPGAVDLGVAAHRTPDSVAIDQIGRRVSERAWLVPGPIVAAEATAAWRHSIESTASVLARDGRVWFVDVGRFHAALWPWVEKSVLTVVVSWAHVDALVSTAPTITEIKTASPVRGLVAGKPDHSLAEVESFLGCNISVVTSRPVVEESRTVWDGASRWRRGGRWSEAADLAWNIHETTQMVGAR